MRVIAPLLMLKLRVKQFVKQAQDVEQAQNFEQAREEILMCRYAGVQAGGDAGVPGVHRVHVCARVSASTRPAAATAAEAGEEMW